VEASLMRILIPTINPVMNNQSKIRDFTRENSSKLLKSLS
jgi:hypothetical protein